MTIVTCFSAHVAIANRCSSQTGSGSTTETLPGQHKILWPCSRVCLKSQCRCSSEFDIKSRTHPPFRPSARPQNGEAPYCRTDRDRLKPALPRCVHTTAQAFECIRDPTRFSSPDDQFCQHVPVITTIIQINEYNKPCQCYTPNSKTGVRYQSHSVELLILRHHIRQSA